MTCKLVPSPPSPMLSCGQHHPSFHPPHNHTQQQQLPAVSASPSVCQPQSTPPCTSHELPHPIKPDPSQLSPIPMPPQPPQPHKAPSPPQPPQPPKSSPEMTPPPHKHAHFPSAAEQPSVSETLKRAASSRINTQHTHAAAAPGLNLNAARCGDLGSGSAGGVGGSGGGLACGGASVAAAPGADAAAVGAGLELEEGTPKASSNTNKAAQQADLQKTVHYAANHDGWQVSRDGDGERVAFVSMCGFPFSERERQHVPCHHGVSSPLE